MNVVFLIRERSRRNRRMRWRKLRVQEAAGFPGRTFRSCLLCLLGLECAIGAWQTVGGSAVPLRIVYLERDYQIEWVKENPHDASDIFGIRLDTEELEVEFYHQKSELQKNRE